MPHNPASFCYLRREATLNWLAFGLLLAAWNAADDTAVSGSARKPPELRGYAVVSVRAGKSHRIVNVL